MVFNLSVCIQRSQEDVFQFLRDKDAFPQADDSPVYLEENFTGPGMSGRLAYCFVPEGKGTRLIQKEWIRTHGLARLFEPILARMLESRLRTRLESIRVLLEGGWGASV